MIPINDNCTTRKGNHIGGEDNHQDIDCNDSGPNSDMGEKEDNQDSSSKCHSNNDIEESSMKEASLGNVTAINIEDSLDLSSQEDKQVVLRMMTKLRLKIMFSKFLISLSLRC